MLILSGKRSVEFVRWMSEFKNNFPYDRFFEMSDDDCEKIVAAFLEQQDAGETAAALWEGRL